MPDWNRWLRERLSGLRVPPERESEILAELALQMEQAWQEAVAAGAGEAEAAARAEAQLGDLRSLKAEIEAAERPPEPPVEYRAGVLNGWWTDARYAWRALRRNPAFAALAVATLAFGIGGNTAVFTMVDALLLRDLPYREPHRLVAVETRRTDQPELEAWCSAADFYDYRERAQSFSAMASVSVIWNMVYAGPAGAEQLDALFVSAELFPMLGVRPALGRVFRAEEDRRGRASPVVVVSHSFWQRRLNASREAIGKPLRLDAGVFQVIGVLPPDFRWAGEPVSGTATDVALYFPMAANSLINSMRGVRYLKAVAQLKPGVAVASAGRETHRIASELAAQYPATDRGYDTSVRPLADQVKGNLRLSMWLLLGTVGFVLLMACANVANLLLVRAAARSREIAVRVAIGASIARLVRQLLTEGLVLACLGGLAGIPLAWAGLRALVALGPDTLIHPGQIRLDWRAMAFTSAAVLACAVLAGLPPAWRAARVHIAGALRDSGRAIAGGRHRMRAALVVIQVSAALILLVGAGLLIRSFSRLLAVPAGFDTRNLVTISAQLPNSARTPALRRAFYQRIEAALLAAPGVTHVGAVSRMPFSGRSLGTWVYKEGMSTPGAPGVEVEYRVATAGYFAAMRIPLLDGRLYDARDDADPTAAVVVNQALARRIWPGEAAVGKRLRLTGALDGPWSTVVGVVANVRHFGLEVEPRPEVYRPYAINPLGAPVILVRTLDDAAPRAGELSAIVRSIDPAIPTYNVYPVDRLVARSTTQRRFVMLLLSGFAVAALLLAGLGIYGTVSQTVAQRTPEIGVRMALGATPREVQRMILLQGARLLCAGAVVGAAVAAALAWILRGVLFEVHPLDPASFAGAVAILALFAVAACYIPARRATRVDPLIALRWDA